VSPACSGSIKHGRPICARACAWAAMIAFLSGPYFPRSRVSWRRACGERFWTPKLNSACRRHDAPRH
jgi:hypothetical protein